MNYIITGATSDVGIAVIENLSSKKDNKILAVSRKESQKVKKISNEKLKYLSGIDLTSETELSKFSQAVNDYFYEPFTLIHSVGNFWFHKPMESVTYTEAEEMFKSHYFTLYCVLKEIIPILKRLGGGRIIAFSCNSVGYNYPEMTAFTSAKAAIETLIKCVANENSAYGIIANAIALSTILTKKVENLKSNKYHKDYITINELTKVIEDLSNMSPLINGNIIRLLKYSNFFYNEGYFQRNPSKYK